MKLYFAVICSIFMIGCSQQQSGGEKTFLLPWRDANGNYQLQKVTLSTLDSPLELKGQAAEIYFQSPLTMAGYTGAIAHPHLTLSGNTYVPLDAESSLSLGVYAQMEHLYRFDQQLGVDAQIKWPRKVGVELNLIAVGGTAHDNAQYFSTLDAIGLLPYSKTSGVPISINQGILGHEHFHAHFQAEVMNQLDHILDRTVNLLHLMFYAHFGIEAQADPSTLFAQNDVRDPKFLNGIVLRAWNEGLADFYGSIYTNTPDFFSVTLPQLATVRRLSDRPVTLDTGKTLADFANAHPELPSDQFVGIAYGEGTLLARAMFQIAHNGTEPPTVFLKRILNALKNIPARVNPNLASTVMNFETVLPILLADFPLNRVTCQSIQSVASGAMLSAYFQPCLNLLSGR